jgi:hypothetical protein
MGNPNYTSEELEAFFQTWNPGIGELNVLQRKNSNLYDYDTGDALDPWRRMKRVVNNHFADARKMTHTGTWNAICLHSVVEYYKTGEVLGYSLSADLGRPVRVIAVIARIPELDAHIPWPEPGVNPNDMTVLAQQWFKMHRTFYGSLSGRYGVSEIPALGDIIEVDFKDRIQRKGNMYITVRERGIGTMPASPDSSGDTAGEASALFAAPGATPTSVENYEETGGCYKNCTQEQEQLAKAEQATAEMEATDKLDDIGQEDIERFADETGMNLALAQAYFDENYKE